MSDLSLTPNEREALIVLVRACLRNCAGPDARPMFLIEVDPFVWVSVEDLTEAGWTEAEARGTFSTLAAKGLITGPDWYLTEGAIRLAETMWIKKESK